MNCAACGKGPVVTLMTDHKLTAIREHYQQKG